MEKKKKILLIDDESDLVEMIKLQLETRGYEVVTAANGVEGQMKLLWMKPSLIILDMNMPRMGGLEFYNSILSPHGRTKYPVLVLTARANLEKTFKDIEVDGFLSKPFEIDVLLSEVDRIASGASHSAVYLVDFKDSPHVKQIVEFMAAERYAVSPVEDFVSLKLAGEMKKPDFIFLEYMQKKTNPFELIKLIKGDPLFSGVPVMVYSTVGFDAYREKSLEAGADGYLGKPDGGEALLKAIKEWKFRKSQSA